MRTRSRRELGTDVTPKTKGEPRSPPCASPVGITWCFLLCLAGGHVPSLGPKQLGCHSGVSPPFFLFFLSRSYIQGLVNLAPPASACPGLDYKHTPPRSAVLHRSRGLNTGPHAGNAGTLLTFQVYLLDPVCGHLFQQPWKLASLHLHVFEAGSPTASGVHFFC